MDTLETTENDTYARPGVALQALCLLDDLIIQTGPFTFKVTS